MTAPATGEHWTTRAACADANTNPAVFFPDKGCPTWDAAAKAICGTCPVVAECLRASMEAEYSIGVWGGMTLEERRTRGLARSHAEYRRARRARKRDEVAVLTDRGMSASEIGQQLGMSQREVVRLRREGRSLAVLG